MYKENKGEDMRKYVKLSFLEKIYLRIQGLRDVRKEQFEDIEEKRNIEVNSTDERSC